MTWKVNKTKVDEIARSIVSSLNQTYSAITDNMLKKVKVAYDTVYSHSPKLADELINASLDAVDGMVNKSIRTVKYIVDRLAIPTGNVINAVGNKLASAANSATDLLITTLIAYVINKITGKYHSITRDDIISPTDHSQGGNKDMNDTQKKPEKTGNPDKGKTNQNKRNNYKKKGKSDRQNHNDPKWYTNLDTHTEFRLVTGYPDALTPINYPSVQYRSVINTIRQVYIPSTGPERTARTQQIFDMLKAVRGLSGNLPYTIADIMQYLDVTYWAVNEYYRLLAALRVSYYFSLQKSPLLPNSIIDDIGFTDIVANKAQYIELLCSMHNFIKNSLPTMGTLLEKIKHQWDSIIPDSNDVDFATWYMYISDHNAYIETSETSAVNLRPCINVEEDAEYPRAYSSNSLTNTYQLAVEGWQLFMETVSLNTVFSAIRGDMLGAFGPSVVLDLDLNYSRDIFGKYNELALMKIHNTEFAYMNTIIAQPSDGNFVSSSNQEVTFNPQYSASGETEVGVNVYYQNFSDLSSPFMVVPHIPGTKVVGKQNLSATGVPVALEPGNIVFDVHKPNLTEGEALELSDAKLVFRRFVRASDTMITFTLTHFSDYVPFYMQGNFFTITVPDNGLAITQTDTAKLCSSAIHTFGGIAGNELTYFNKLSSLISQSDWAPRITVSQHYAATNVATSNTLWDTNILASLSPEAFAVAIRYIKYSIFSGNVSIGNKRFDNLVAVFNSTK